MSEMRLRLGWYLLLLNEGVEVSVATVGVDMSIILSAS